MTENPYAGLQQKLDEQYQWPTQYLFKFIVPESKREELEALFPRDEVSSRYSKNGNYVSLTAQVLVESSQAVIEVYRKAHAIEGTIGL